MIVMPTYISTKYVCRLYLQLTLYLKGMKSLLSGAIGEELEKKCPELAERVAVRVYQAAAEPDRLHFLIELTSGQSVSEVVNSLQKVTTAFLREDFSAWFPSKVAVWEQGYAARTAGIPYLHLRALSPLVGWPTQSKSAQPIHLRRFPQINMKQLAKVCAQADVEWKK
ncbi:MAG: hypothetical protein A2788_01260 [Candidatus Abawacabacteria bacterium RIFCSPHIGHO2_01_FULL_46_8]|uniref:Transposase IS200-like domain-containing protein n=1 Tax=Candidatus Abawacabacteria bacterium RIFCSPHIGHO2_01_FULL_46_8 TaxID=1817815 RepID=A0A1F4XHL3_9BACT|nr:MAG: hypothetical protein A2788_01260 [Candidatus Abawacabacteria bacterium RIFCSPHIGHO2_01_FULL_46_8]